MQVIIGSDLVYEHGQAQLLAAALAHRLAPGGRATLVCPVRDEVHVDNPEKGSNRQLRLDVSCCFIRAGVLHSPLESTDSNLCG